MSCKCQQTPQPPQAQVELCEAPAPDTHYSEGHELPICFTDARCGDEGMTILGRVGRRLARFGGSGFVRVLNGVATLTDSVPVKITSLWHRWAKSNDYLAPSPQEPLPASYGVVADESGQLHIIRGNQTEKSAQVWNPSTNMQEQVPLSEIETCRKGNLARAEELVLAGFEQILPDQSPDLVKCLKALSGSGLLVVEERDTVLTECLCDGCTPAPAKVSVAKFLANPTEEGNFTLKFNTVDGHFWEADPVIE